VIVTRPDLFRRTALSKSEISTARWCELQAFYSRTDPRPWIVTPDMAFGSALDAAIEVAVTALRADMAIPTPRCLAAASEVAMRDEQEVDLEEVGNAVELFGVTVAPRFDWSHGQFQQTIRVPIDGLGECEGHPDLLLPDTILDVKSAKRAKTEADIYFGSELGFYALLRERETGERVKEVGYLTWIRLKHPLWQTLVVEVTDDLLAEGMTHARRQVQLRKLIDTVKEKGADPTLYFSGPRFDSKCLDCAWVDGCEVGQRRLRRLQKEEEPSVSAA
jgi:hypothetical protein